MPAATHDCVGGQVGVRRVGDVHALLFVFVCSSVVQCQCSSTGQGSRRREHTHSPPTDERRPESTQRDQRWAAGLAGPRTLARNDDSKTNPRRGAAVGGTLVRQHTTRTTKPKQSCTYKIIRLHVRSSKACYVHKRQTNHACVNEKGKAATDQELHPALPVTARHATDTSLAVRKHDSCEGKSSMLRGGRNRQVGASGASWGNQGDLNKLGPDAVTIRIWSVCTTK